MPSQLQNLGTSYVRLFERLGKLEDLGKVIEYHSRAVHLTPDGHPHLPILFLNLCACLKMRFQCLGALVDLSTAIEFLSRALVLTHDGHPYMSTLLHSPGVSYAFRFRRLGELGDLERAIQCQSRALALTPDSHADLPGRLHDLGVSHHSRFQRLGGLGDLERAIEYQSRALALTPDGHPALSNRFQNLGAYHNSLFEHLGELGELEKAIKYEFRALASTPDDHPHLSMQFQNLGVYHTRRFERLGQLGDLAKAIDYHSHALTLTPDGDPRLPSLLQNLGVSLRYRFECVERIGDIKRAIEYQSRALSLTPDGHPHLSDLLHNLGMSHGEQFSHLHKQEDLESAIECIACSVELTPNIHPQLSHIHYSLAGYRFLQYRFTGDTSYLQDSLYSYRMATQSLSGSPHQKFRCAIAWAKRVSEESSLNCIEAYQTAIDLLPQFIWLGATAIQRYEDLISVGTLAIDAASAAILASNRALSLEWLEHARCVVWNQTLMLRSPLDTLSLRDPILAGRLQTVAAQLHRAGSSSRESQAIASGSLTLGQVAQRHHLLAQEYTDLISQARALSGFENFLRPLKTIDLVRAARYGPIVVINCHRDRCDALVIKSGQDHIDHIPLPNITQTKAELYHSEMGRLARSEDLSERGVERRPVLEEPTELANVLATLWYDVVKPVLDHLGYMEVASDGNLPHITWCPTGTLSFLPLHAAGGYDQPGSRVFDYVISSYTPTLSALLPSMLSTLSNNSRVLVIGQPNTPGHNPLPGTAEELAYVKGHTTGRVEYSQLVGNEAKTTTVLDAMEEHDWGFFLHDGALDLASINRRLFKNKGLAYLSACQTAKGDEKLPDEAIHLASGMLMAGYSSVIATMWSVMDDDAPFVADKVYGQLMKDGKLGNGEAGKALHYAVAELREKIGEGEFKRWVPYIHIGS